MRDNRFFPGDIVRFGFGMFRRGKYDSHNTVCVTDIAEGKDRYKAVWLTGDCYIPWGEYCLLYDETEVELLFTTYPEKHKLKVKKL